MSSNITRPMAKGSNRVENGVLLTPPPRNVGNKEHFQRMNHLYQLAMWHTISGNDGGEQALARLYAKNMDLVSKRTRAEMLPQLKRTICKKCHRILVPKKTMRVQMNSGSLQLVCSCGSVRNFPIHSNRGYHCHAERDENLISI
ncbi:hypothetical protein ZYGR_0AV01690 [Zygosaccharomyces rouxii]|uniref:Uncharacterized protein n=1 Tax=Zygosaccharomyces rouxii TaxID=4956 RepID=A0A1Q3AII6_ZYGRO|nr:hypothetical protein ZYGR_0AV01690 [Zygosaccharomyces rouxii]